MSRQVSTRILTLAGMLALLAATVTAADPQADKKKADLDPGIAAYIKAATPSPQHKLLEPLVGSWAIKVKSWMDPTQPPTESTGHGERKWILGGRFLTDEFHGQFFDQPFTGLGWTGYDNIQKKFVNSWIDTMSTGIIASQGTCDSTGKVFTYTSEEIDPSSGQKVKGREIVRILDDNQHTATFFKTGPDGKEIKVMEITFTRKGATPGR